MNIPLRKESLPYTTTEYDDELEEPVTSSSWAEVIEWIIPQRFAHADDSDDFQDIEEIVNDLESNSEWASALSRARKSLSETDIASERMPGLTRLRLAKGYSQAELGRRVGTSQSHIARIETCKADPQLGTLRRIAAALEVQVSQVVVAISESQ